MRHRRLLRLIRAACLTLCAVAFTYRAATAAVVNLSAGGRAAAAAPRPCMLLRGKQLFTLAGYELNATFTPGGEFHCFEINRL